MFLLRISFLSTVCAVLVAGCATSMHSAKELTREECADNEWQEVGLRDGRNGTPHSAEFHRYLNECAKHSESLDGEKAAYARGLEEGYVVYCHSANAEQMGVLGTAFHEDFCPKAERPSLVSAYRKGLARAKTNTKIK